MARGSRAGSGRRQLPACLDQAEPLPRVHVNTSAMREGSITTLHAPGVGEHHRVREDRQVIAAFAGVSHQDFYYHFQSERASGTSEQQEEVQRRWAKTRARDGKLRRGSVEPTLKALSKARPASPAPGPSQACCPSMPLRFATQEGRSDHSGLQAPEESWFLERPPTPQVFPSTLL